MTRPRVALGTALIAVTIAALLGSCGTSTQVVRLGGATVERPWGTVKTFPPVEKAQIPAMADLTFVRHMIVHHQQAIELSETVLEQPDLDPRVAAAARFIAYDQQREITAMQQWLDAWMSTPGVLPHGAHHGGELSGPSAGHPMPGMVSQAAVEQLRRLSATESQREFVDLMVFHHEGAITMSHDVIDDGRNDFVINVARHLIREQGQEIDYLIRLGPELDRSADENP